MSTLTTHTTASRDSHSTGLCKFNTTSKAIEVSDGTDWLIYDYDTIAVPTLSNSYSASFDGVDDHLYFGTSATNRDITVGSSDLAVSLWFYADDTTASALFQNTSAGSRCFLNAGTLTLKGYGTQRDITSAYSANNWYHLVVERQSGTQKIYINGSEADSITGQTGSFNISSFGYRTGAFLTGHLDEISFHSQGLSATDVSDIYNNGLPRNVAVGFNTTGWWRMGDASSGTTITDQVGSENLTASGAILTDTNVPT